MENDIPTAIWSTLYQLKVKAITLELQKTNQHSILSTPKYLSSIFIIVLNHAIKATIRSTLSSHLS